MHFVVARLLSVAIITETYFHHIQNIRPMNHTHTQLIKLSYANAQLMLMHEFTNI